MDLIWKRIDFLPEFMVLLDTLREMEISLKNIILKITKEVLPLGLLPIICAVYPSLFQMGLSQAMWIEAMFYEKY